MYVIRLYLQVHLFLSNVCIGDGSVNKYILYILMYVCLIHGHEHSHPNVTPP